MNSSVFIVAKNTDNRYLLQMRDNNPGIDNALKWCVFGGSVEADEDVNQAVVREFKEETGYQITKEDLEPLGQITTSKGGTGHVFRYTKTVDWDTLVVNEGAGAGFFTKQDALKIPITYNARLIIEQYFEE